MSKSVSFIYSIKTTFVSKDITLINSLGYKINEIKSQPYKSILKFIIARLNEIWCLIKNFNKCKYYIIWFNDYHAIIPLLYCKIFNKKSLLIVGGYDAIKYKKINYGIFTRNRFISFFLKKNFLFASEIWTVDKSLITGCENSKKMYNIKSGVLNFLKNKKINIKEVHTGYHKSFWTYKLIRKEKNVCTVGIFNNEKVIKRKNIEFFLEIAKKMPKNKFTIVGDSKGIIEKNYSVPINVKIIKVINSREKLRQIYQKHKFYFQGSHVEGLPNVLCESMLCGCIPIGNNVFGIPNAIGDTGYIFKGEKDLDNIISFINKNNIEPTNPRNRIINKFNINKRKLAFKKFLS